MTAVEDTQNEEEFAFSLEGDLGNLPEPQYELVSEGNHYVRLSNVKFVVSSQKGTPGINWETTLTEDEEESGKLWDDTWLSSAALWRVKQNAEAFLGSDFDVEINIKAQTKEEFHEMLSEWIDDNIRPLIGERAIAIVVHEPYVKKNGTPAKKAVVSEFLPDDGSWRENTFGGSPASGLTQTL